MSHIQTTLEKFIALNPDAKIDYSTGIPCVRQGDTFIWFQESAPDGLIKEARDAQNRAIVALGEVTGHAHAFEVEVADIYLNPKDNTRWLLVEDAIAPYVHEEHDTHLFPEGTIAIVTIQRELDLKNRQSSRPVWD